MAFLILAVSLNSCAPGSGPVPSINVETWAGDSANDAITRKQDARSIRCTMPDFDNYVCLSYTDLKAIYEVIQECKQWPPGTPMTSMDRIIERNDDAYHQYFKRAQ